MKPLLSTACALAALTLAGSAFAQDSVTATLQSPLAGHVKLIAAHAVFKCEATTCIAAIAPDDANGVSACKDLARQVGPLSAYEETKPLGDKDLAKCNAVASKPRILTASVR